MAVIFVPAVESKSTEKLEWIPVLNGNSNPEAWSVCSKCSRKVIMHPNYIRAGIPSCGKCHKLSNIAEQMIKLKGWKFIKAEKEITSIKYMVYYICSNGHSRKITYEALRKGSNCTECTNTAQIKSKMNVIYVRPDCDCKNRSGKKPKICEHYNHTTCPNGGAEEWHHELNKGLKADEVSPKTKKKFWYECSHDWCNMPYEQSIQDRSTGSRCPYCAGRKVCDWNCLQVNYPELCEELDPDNVIKAHQVTTGSNIKLGWICNKHDPPHKYETMVKHRVTSKSGCARCVSPGGEQTYGGHEYFVRESMTVHNGKYSYSEEYKGTCIPINIYCPVMPKEGDITTIHGNFLQTPQNHKSGQGCPKCFMEQIRSKLITDIHVALDEIGLKGAYTIEHPFPGLFHKKPLRVDVFISGMIFVIEGDGVQHFSNPKTWGGIETLKENRERDLIKDLYCIENKISILRIPYNMNRIKDLILLVISMINSGHIVYASYDPFFQQVRMRTNDMSHIYYLEIETPKIYKPC